MRSEAPFMTLGWSPNAAVAFTNPPRRTTDTTHAQVYKWRSRYSVMEVPEPDGVEHVRWRAAQAIATLGMTYEDSSDPVPDRLWAEAVNRTVDWVRAEE
jgi:hypothetical protein